MRTSAATQDGRKPHIDLGAVGTANTSLNISPTYKMWNEHEQMKV